MVKFVFLLPLLFSSPLLSQRRVLMIGGTKTQNLPSLASPAGDMNGDNVPDLLVGNSVFSGKDGKLLKSFAAGLGATSIAGGFDLNGDGTPDAVFGNSQKGVVLLVSGKTGKILFQWKHRNLLDHWGYKVGIRPGPHPQVYSWGQDGFAFFSPKTGKVLDSKSGNVIAFQANVDLDGDKIGDIVQIRWFLIGFIDKQYYLGAKLSRKKSFSLTLIPSTRVSFDFAIAPHIDRDGDGIKDLLLVQKAQTGPTLFFLTQSRTQKLRKLFSFTSNYHFSPLSLSDLDQDGIPEYAYFDSIKGSVLVNHGKDHSLFYEHHWRGRLGFGSAMVRLGDRDGNGTDEFLIYDGDQKKEPGGWNLFSYEPKRNHAAYLSLFEPKAPGTLTPPSLRGLSDPLVGEKTILQVLAPGAQFGVVLSGLKAHPGDVAPLPGNPLPLYLDKRFLFPFTLPFSIVAGKGTIQIPLPNSDALFGLDLGFQGLTFYTGKGGNLAVTNLLLANPGVPFKKGLAPFDQALTFALPLKGNANDALGRPLRFLQNTGPSFFLHLKGKKDPSLGTIEFRTAPGIPPNGGGLLLGKLGAATSSFQTRFWIPPGIGKPLNIYILHSGGKAMGRIRLTSISREDG